jgi:hypothetical protein
MRRLAASDLQKVAARKEKLRLDGNQAGSPDMTPRIPQSNFTWQSPVGTAVPPRDPDVDNGEGEEEDEDGGADEDLEPPVIREPDEGE